LIFIAIIAIIGILAAVAIPKFADTKKKAYVMAMRSDLKKLVPAAEAFFSDNNTYVGFVAPAGSSGVALSVSNLSATGWAGAWTHANATGSACAIGVGSAAPAGLAEGQLGGATCK